MAASKALTKQAGKFLEPGEAVLAAAKCLPRGASKRRATGGLLFGVVGVLAAGGTASGPVVFGRPLATNMAVVVTNRRLMFFRLSEATDRIAELTHSTPLHGIAQIQSEVGKSVGMKAVYITLTFMDGSAASLEAVRPNTQDAQAVANAISGGVGHAAGNMRATW